MTTNIGPNTIQDMQAAVLGNTICVVCNDNTEPSFSGETSGFMSATSTGTGWSHQYSKYNTLSCPAIVSWNGIFQAFYADENGEINHLISSDGLNWTWHDNTHFTVAIGSWESSPSGGVSAVTDGSNLHLFYMGSSGGTVYHTQWTAGATSWAPAVAVGLNAMRGMSAAVLDQTVCVVCIDNTTAVGYSNALMWATLSPGGTWESGNTGAETLYDPGITVFNGRFVVYFGNGLTVGVPIYEYYSSDGQTWYEGNSVNQDTSGGCCPVEFPQGELALFWRDPGGGAVQT